MSDDSKNGSEPGQQHSPGELAAAALSELATPLLTNHDPRAMVQGFLENACVLAQKIVAAKRWTHQQVAAEFTGAMLAALAPVPEKSRIQIADATGQVRRQ